jgi:hypothetical protein
MLTWWARTSIRAVLCVGGCGSKDTNESRPAPGSSSSATPVDAAPGSSSSATPVDAAAPSIRLPHVGRHESYWAGAVVVQDGKLVPVDPNDIQAVDAQGGLVPANGSWHPPRPPPPDDPPPPPDAATIVAVDRELPASRLRALLAPLSIRCIGFLGHDGTQAWALVPNPCPPRVDPDNKAPQLAIRADKDGFTVTVSQIAEVRHDADRKKLEQDLKERKASLYFEDRNDLAIAVHDGATAGDVIELLDLAYEVGFTAPRWVDAKDLPSMQDATMTPAPKPHPDLMSIGKPNAQGDLDKAIIRRYIKLNQAKLAYFYEKQLLTKPNLAGTVTAQFLIDPQGNVTNSTAAGVDPEVASCVANVIKKIEFPKPKSGSVQVDSPFVFRKG